MIVIDNDTLASMKNGNILDVAESDMLFFARTEDLPGKKAPGSAINIDGREYTVDLWTSMLQARAVSSFVPCAEQESVSLSGVARTPTV